MNITDFQKAAATYGGKCYANGNENQYTKVDWQCERRHRFSATLFNVRSGVWCRQCSKLEIKEKYLNEVNEIAISKGGQCISKVYINNHTHLEFRCGNGHTFFANANNIKSGWWCKYCSGKFKHDIEIYRRYAEQKGGTLLSKKYINVDTNLKWQCENGHIWKAKPYYVKSQGYWCPYCSEDQRKIRSAEGFYYTYSISDMQKKAAEKGGWCLSKNYHGADVSLKWKCREGHTWMARPAKINTGQWCRKCAMNANGIAKRLPLSHYSAIVESHGGRVLSTQKSFLESYPIIKIKCENGHSWETTATNISGGSWCPHCKYPTLSKLTRMPFAAYQKIAEEKKGKLLSSEDVYVNGKSYFKWQCESNHTWIAQASAVRSGTWCPHCYRNRQKKAF